VVILTPDFDWDENSHSADSAAVQLEIKSQPVMANRRPLEFQLKFPPLEMTPGQAQELEAALKPAVMLMGTQAKETEVKKVRGPAVLHLVTHGFFLSDEKLPA